LTREKLKNFFQSETIEFSGMSDSSGNINFDSNIEMQTWKAFKKYKIDIIVPNPRTTSIDLCFTRIVPNGYGQKCTVVNEHRSTEGSFPGYIALRKGKNFFNVKTSGIRIFRKKINVTITLTMFFEDTNTIELTDQVINKAKNDSEIKDKNVVCAAISDRLIESLLMGRLENHDRDYKVGFDFEVLNNPQSMMRAYVKLPQKEGDPSPFSIRIFPVEQYIFMEITIYFSFILKSTNQEYAIGECKFEVKITPELRKDSSEVLKIKAKEAKFDEGKIQVYPIIDAILNQQFPPTNPIRPYVIQIANYIKNVTNTSINFSLIIPNFIHFIEFPHDWNRTEDFLIFFKKFYWKKGIVEGREAGFLFPVFTVKGLTGIYPCLDDKENSNIQRSIKSKTFLNRQLDLLPFWSYHWWFAFAFSQESLNEIANTMIKNKVNKHERISKPKTIQPVYAEGTLEYSLELKLNKITILDNELHFEFEFASAGGRLSLKAKNKITGAAIDDWHFSLSLIFRGVSVLSTIGIEEFNEPDIPSEGDIPRNNWFIRIHTSHDVSIEQPIEVDLDISSINPAVDWVIDKILGYVADKYKDKVESIANKSLNNRPHLINIKSIGDDETHMPDDQYIDTVFNKNSSLILIGSLSVFG
jgi:hypothetical protein